MEEISTKRTLDEAADLAAAMAAKMRHDRFVGTHEVNIDASGRISIPSVYRRAFDEGALHMAPVRDRNLEVWTPHTFELVLDHRRRLGIPRLGGPRGLKMFQSRTASIAVDKQFRMVVPPAFRERIGLDPTGDRVVVVGVGEALEIWPHDVWYDQDDSGEIDEAEYEGF